MLVHGTTILTVYTALIDDPIIWYITALVSFAAQSLMMLMLAFVATYVIRLLDQVDFCQAVFCIFW